VCVCKLYILEKLVAIQKFIWSFIAHFRSLTSHIILKDFTYKQNIPRRLNKDSSSIHTRIITAFITRNSLLVLATRNLQLATRNSHSHSHAWRLPCSSWSMRTLNTEQRIVKHPRSTKLCNNSTKIISLPSQLPFIKCLHQRNEFRSVSSSRSAKKQAEAGAD
jgi:hypothetical protein